MITAIFTLTMIKIVYDWFCLCRDWGKYNKYTGKQFLLLGTLLMISLYFCGLILRWGYNF